MAVVKLSVFVGEERMNRVSREVKDSGTRVGITHRCVSSILEGYIVMTKSHAVHQTAQLHLHEIFEN